MAKTAQERFEQAKEHQKAIANSRDNKRIKTILSPAVVTQHRGPLLNKQLGLCAICTIQITEGTRLYHLDHDHNTGQIRGVLCHTCNVGLGMFKEDVDIMLAAIDYLNKFRPKEERVEWQLKSKNLPDEIELQLEEMSKNIVQQSVNYEGVLNQEEFDNLPGKDKIAYLNGQFSKQPKWWYEVKDINFQK